ncbi:uncharacterized protein LOC126842545 [Adelges cooleyi]|uniref:uncharacterized protein LOC126842545 n=1 Tax=Adelges cooleyi TaxID=133065 RepID=UPI002180017D|nr:uncharacterized protein LOC126842545 [Adelges cooleyi]
MKSNPNVVLCAVYLFVLMISMNYLPETSCVRETSWVGETSNRPNILPISIRNYIKNVLTNGNSKVLSKTVTSVIDNADGWGSLTKPLYNKVDNIFLSIYVEFLVDKQFIARATEARRLLLLVVDKKTLEVKVYEALLALFVKTKEKLKKREYKKVLKTLKYADNDEKLQAVINIFIKETQWYL